MKPYFVVLLAAAILLAGARDVLASEDGSVAELRAFISVPVKARLEAALRARDLRFLSVYGYALEVPSVPEREATRFSKNGALPIPGTSDALVSEEHGTLNEQARSYAEQYNALLLRHLAQHSP